MRALATLSVLRSVLSFSTHRRYSVVYLLHGMPGSPRSYINSFSLAALSTDAGDVGYAPLIVRAPAPHSRVAVLVPDQTWSAYNFYDDDRDVSYASLAREFGLDTTTVNNYLAAARRDFRRIVLEKMRDVK